MLVAIRPLPAPATPPSEELHWRLLHVVAAIATFQPPEVIARGDQTGRWPAIVRNQLADEALREEFCRDVDLLLSMVQD